MLLKGIYSLLIWVKLVNFILIMIYSLPPKFIIVLLRKQHIPQKINGLNYSGLL